MTLDPQAMAWLTGLSTEALLGQVEARARTIADGHLSLLRFTTCWKACYGTVSFDRGTEREIVSGWLTPHPTLKAALVDLLLHEWRMGPGSVLQDAHGRRYSAQATPAGDICLTTDRP